MKLDGWDAIRYAAANDRLLSKYTDPIEDAREALSVEEAKAIAREDASLIYLDIPDPPFCAAGDHHVEPGKTVNSRGWCNLCLSDARRGRPAGTTARERGPKMTVLAELLDRFGRLQLFTYDHDLWGDGPCTVTADEVIMLHEELGWLDGDYELRPATEPGEPALIDRRTGNAILRLA